MSLSERPSQTSYATVKAVTKTPTEEATTVEAGAANKTVFPTTYTTPQNCFENLSCVSADVSLITNVASAKSDALEQTASIKYLLNLQQMTNILPPDSEKNITIIQNKINANSSLNVSEESVETHQHFMIECDSTLETLQINLPDQTIEEAGRYDITSDVETINLSISQNSSNDINFGEDSLSKSSENSSEFIQGSSGTESSLLKNPLRLSERAKKKSWYNVLYPNYKSRSQDFKRLFKEVSSEERLIVDFSCALYRDLLIQGRLYISQNYVGFHANILGWETCILIKWKDVTAITKEKTALVIPNAISISTPKENYFFSSFTTRDKTFLILFRVWQNSLMNKSLQAREVWELVHNYYGEELGLTTDDEDYIDPSSIELAKSSISDILSIVDSTASTYDTSESFETTKQKDLLYKTSTNSSSSVNINDTLKQREKIMKPNAKELTLISAKPDENNASCAQMVTSAGAVSKESSGDRNSSANSAKENKASTTAYDVKRKVTKSSRIREDSINKKVEILPTDVSDSSDSEGTNIPFVATAECTSPHEGRQLVHTILPINIETLFSLLFSKSKFLLDFHATRKSTELVFGEWITSEDGQRTRTVNVTVQLAASVGPKTSKVTEFQMMRDCSKQGELYSIDVNSVNAGIPYADSFSVLVHYCLVKTVDDHTMLSVHGQIKYKKSIWGVVKGFIEKNTWAGLEDFYGSLLLSLQNETCIPPAKRKGRRPRRGTALQIRSLEDVPPLLNKQEPVEQIVGTHSFNSRSATESSVMVAETTKYRWLSLFVLVLLCFLIIVNVILLLKLWRLEDRLEEDLSNRARMPNLSALKQLPSNHEDWIELLRQQEILHETELRKWHSVLKTAIELLKKVSIVCENIFPNDKLTQQIDQMRDEF